MLAQLNSLSVCVEAVDLVNKLVYSKRLPTCLALYVESSKQSEDISSAFLLSCESLALCGALAAWMNHKLTMTCYEK